MSCELECKNECKAKSAGCASECPALPWQPPVMSELSQVLAQQYLALSRITRTLHAVTSGSLKHLGDSIGDPAEFYANAQTRAAALARELFPPMAKALAWVREQNGRSYGKDHEGRTKYEFGPTLGSNFRKTHAYSCDEMWCFTGENDDEARAACESHHQAKFKELLA